MRNSEDPLVSPRAILKTCGNHCASFSSDRAQFYKLSAATVRNYEDRRVTAKKSEGCQMRSRASLRAVGCQCAFAAGAGCEHSPYVLARSIPHNGGGWVAGAAVAVVAAAASACCGGSGGRDGGSGNNIASCGGSKRSQQRARRARRQARRRALQRALRRARRPRALRRMRLLARWRARRRAQRRTRCWAWRQTRERVWRRAAGAVASAAQAKCKRKPAVSKIWISKEIQ